MEMIFKAGEWEDWGLEKFKGNEDGTSFDLVVQYDMEVTCDPMRTHLDISYPSVSSINGVSWCYLPTPDLYLIEIKVGDALKLQAKN